MKSEYQKCDDMFGFINYSYYLHHQFKVLKGQSIQRSFQNKWNITIEDIQFNDRDWFKFDMMSDQFPNYKSDYKIQIDKWQYNNRILLKSKPLSIQTNNVRKMIPHMTPNTEYQRSC